MKGVNFIPKQRSRQMAVMRRFRAWTLCTACYTILALLTYGAWALVTTGEERLAEQKLERLPQEIEQTQRAIDSIRTQLTDVNGKLDVVRTITEQPDWSILLLALAEAAGPELALSECRLGPAAPGSASGNAPANRAGVKPSPAAPANASLRYLLQLNGIARSQVAVSQFVLRLESLQLFDRVNLLKTSREVFADEDVVIFQIDASISGEGAAKR